MREKTAFSGNFLENSVNSLVNSENFPENFPTKVTFRLGGIGLSPTGTYRILSAALTKRSSEMMPFRASQVMIIANKGKPAGHEGMSL